MADFNLTEEERAKLNRHPTLYVSPRPMKDTYVGDVYPCPRCQRGTVVPHAAKPCIACQLKAAEARIEELEAKIAETAE